jgi:hypothetical protein
VESWQGSIRSQHESIQVNHSHLSLRLSPTVSKSDRLSRIAFKESMVRGLVQERRAYGNVRQGPDVEEQKRSMGFRVSVGGCC